MAENVLKIEYAPIDSINPYPNNAKLHPAEQIEQIKKSIAEDNIDAGEVEDKTNSKVAVKMVFENVEVWRKNEEAVREFLDKMEKVSLSVGEYNEN